MKDFDIKNINIRLKDNSQIKDNETLAKLIEERIAQATILSENHKNIEQLYLEQQNQTQTSEHISTSTEGGATTATQPSALPTAVVSTTPSVSMGNNSTVNLPQDTSQESQISTATQHNSSIENTSENPSAGSKNNTTNNDGTLTGSAYYPQLNQQETVNIVSSASNSVSNQESIDTKLKEKIQEKINEANKNNDQNSLQYWSDVLSKLNSGTTTKKLLALPGHKRLSELYTETLKEMNHTEARFFDWESVREKMIRAIDANILNGRISNDSKTYWNEIRKSLINKDTNITNLFEQYDELFLLLKEVEGLSELPSKISFFTKTKIYPNLSADKMYANLNNEDIYTFLKKAKSIDILGAGVNKGAVLIKNSTANSFITGETIEFGLNETLINDTLNPRGGINWAIYLNNKRIQIFKDQGISLNYQFDKVGKYIVEAYGKKAGANSKKGKKESAFIELSIVHQEIEIDLPQIIKDGLARPFTTEKQFGVKLKENKIAKPLQPIALSYQIQYKGKGKETTTITDAKLIPNDGVINLAMPQLGTYTLIVKSNDQYAINYEKQWKIIENYVESVQLINNEQSNNVYLQLDTPQEVSFAVKKFKIEPPTTDEIAKVKWVFYNKKDLHAFNNDKTKIKQPFAKGTKATFKLPLTEGNYYIEAYSNNPEGNKFASSQKIQIVHPRVTDVSWTDAQGDRKEITGFKGETAFIKASIPNFGNQKVRVFFYVKKSANSAYSKEHEYYSDTTTDANGNINKQIVFNDKMKSEFKLGNGENAFLKIGFIGYVNNKPYPFKEAKYSAKDVEIQLTTKRQLLDLYFEYDGRRVIEKDRVPYDAKKVEFINLIAKTRNMAGEKLTFKAHELGKQNILEKIGETVVKSNGVASIILPSSTIWGLDTIFDIQKNKTKTFYAGVEGFSTKHIEDKTLVLEEGAKWDNGAVFDENDPQLVWGAKVSHEFRKKVVQICKNIEEKKGITFTPNTLMNIMAFETANTFSPSSGTFKYNPEDSEGGYVGLIQFGKAASDHLKVKRSELMKMTAEKQLDYVEQWFLLKTKNELKSATDIYLSVNYPKAAGNGHNDSYIVYGDPKAAYRANKPFLRESDEINKKGEKIGKVGGKTYVWEVREALEENYMEGEFRINTIRMDKQYNSIIRNPREIFNLDTSLKFCYFYANQIKEIRNSIAKLTTTEEQIKAYRILQYFVKYNSQRDAEYKTSSGKRLADTMCNVVSESMALQFLGKMNPAPDPNMKMEDFMMIMIKDYLKLEDDSRFSVDTRIKIANQLGIKGSFSMVEEIFNKNKHKKLLEDKLNKGYGLCMSTLGHIVRIVDVNDMGILIDDPYGRIQSYVKRKNNGNSGGYNGGKNSSDNLMLKGESNLWTWENLKNDKIEFRYYEWYYL